MEDNKSIFSDTYEVIDYLQSGSGGMVYKAYHKRLKETYQEEIPDIKIKDAKKVTLKLTIEAEEIGEQSNTIDLSVIKIGKKWYMDLMERLHWDVLNNRI